MAESGQSPIISAICDKPTIAADGDNTPGGPLNLMAFVQLLLVWAPAAAAGIYTKWAMLRWDGYLKTALSLGRPVVAGDGSQLFTLGEKLSFFRADLLLTVVVVPIGLLFLSMWRNRLRLWLVALIGIGWIAVMTVQLEAFRIIGSFQSLELMNDALRWGFENGRQARTYILGMAIFRLACLIAAVLLTAILASMRRTWSGAWSRRTQASAIAVWALLLGVTGLCWLPWMPSTASHSSVHLAALAALPDSRVISSLGSLPQAELKRRYRQLVDAPKRRDMPANWAAAREYDVLFFVLETTPARCVAFDGPIDDLPNIRELRKQAWIGSRHYSTYPITARALFSLLTSVYPSDSSKDNVRLRDRLNSGLIRNLNSAGYQTGVYGSSASIIPWAKDVFENLGFKHIRAADEGPGSRSWEALGIHGPLDPHVDTQSYVVHQQGLDLRALDELKTDMTGWIQSNERFAAVYLPQVSHGPWGDVRTSGQEASPLGRCRGLVELQDKWLGDILGLLRQRGRLSRTLVIVTGDHGVRSSVEDPAFPIGVTDEYSFQVPFLLYAPGVLDSTNTLTWITSHIDVEPSILDLLGISRDTDSEQGAPLWDEQLTQRTTYFLANLFHGVDGYHSKGRFYSWNRTLDITYQNDQLRFGPKQVVPASAPLHDQITKNIRAFDQLKAAWFRASER